MIWDKINARDLLAIRHRPSLPIVLQNERAACGLACLTMISQYFGHQIDLNGMKKLFPNSANATGMNMAQLVDLSQRLQLQTRALKLSLAQLKDLKLPAILHWDLDHFVVLKQFKRQRAIIHDPAKGRCVLTLNEVSKHFTGIALEFRQTAQFVPVVEQQRVALLDVVGGIQGWFLPFLSILLVSLLLEVFNLSAPFYMQWILDQVIVSADLALLNLLFVLFLTLAILTPILAAFRLWSVSRLSAMINIQWLNNITHHLLRLPLDWFEKRSVGDVMSRLRSVDTIEGTLSGNLVASLLNGVMSLILLSIMMFYSVRMTLFLLLLIVIYLLFRLLYLGIFRHLQENMLNLSAVQQSEILETVRAILTIKLANLTAIRQARYLNCAIDSSNAKLRLVRLDILFKLGNTLIFGVGRITLIWYAAKLTLANQFTVGAFVAYLAYCDMFSRAVVDFIDKWLQFYLLKLYAIRLSDITFTPIEQNDSAPFAASRAVSLVDYSLELQNISFKYQDNAPWLLRDFSLKVQSGEVVALVGPSGCGKTTLVKIMLGLIPPSSGAIYFGGQSIESIGVPHYRDYIGTVMQNDQLFAGSIAENICLFKDNPNQQALIAAAKAANIHDDIMQMTMNYSSLVGDMGSILSGGQKQRLLLARALYRQPKLLILDEATSHLDIANETIINQTLMSLQITRIIIAHRPETIKLAHRVISLG